jgi:hypothetical protein
MKIETTQVEVAADHLDWAIRLFLDHQAYVPAITLAGAAEGILCKMAQRSTFDQLKTNLMSQYPISEKDLVNEHLNNARNLLKHYRGPGTERVTLEPDLEAIHYIIRGLNDLHSYDGSLPSEGLRFLTWIHENRRDLYGDRVTG